MRIWSIVFLAACGPSLELAESPAPVDVTGMGSFYADVAYDEHERTTFDLLLPEGDGPFPVVWYIHGGGFTSGEKEAAWTFFEDDVQAAMTAGVAYGSIGYRLLEDVDLEGVIKPMTDAQHAVQFGRYHSDSLRLDPEEVTVYGVSAGAGTALWLGTHDDLADPNADNRAWRESSRVKAVAALETQATYDLVRWESDVLGEYGITLDIAANFGLENRLLSFYGAPSLDAVRSDATYVSYRENVDMLGLMDPDDAPIRVQNTYIEATIPFSVDALFHHPNHAREVQAAAEAAGLSVDSYIPMLDVDDTDGELHIDFLLDAM